jgi:hypothetical protein
MSDIPHCWAGSGVLPGPSTASRLDPTQLVTRASLTIAFVALLLVAAPAHAAPVFDGDLETGNLSQYASSPWNFQGVSGPTIVRHPVRQGQYALEFRVPSGAKRQELILPSSIKFTEGMDRWFGWSYMIDPITDFRGGSWGNQVIVQWKADGTGGPPIGMALTPEKRIIVNAAGHSWKQGPCANGTPCNAGPATTGVWIDFVVHVKFTTNRAASLVELWRDGVKMFSQGNWQGPGYSGSTLKSGAQSYLKHGIYRDPAAPGTVRLWSDDWRIGTSYADVAPTGTPDDTEVPDDGEVPEDTDLPEDTEVPDEAEVPEETEVPDSTQVGAAWTPPTGTVVGRPVTFDGTASTGDPPITCDWEFTDRTGSIVYSTGTGCLHEKTFVYPGRKYARLRVADDDGEKHVSPVQTFYAAPGTTTRLHTGAF